MKRLHKPTRIILYQLAKRGESELVHLRNNAEGRSLYPNEKESLRQTVYRLMKKGYVDKRENEKGRFHSNTYFLTDKGKELAAPIVKEVDEFKQWGRVKRQ